MLAYEHSPKRIVLIGLESAGKTTLFSRLDGRDAGYETNVKGTTYSVHVQQAWGDYIVDTPGIRDFNTASNNIAVQEIYKADKIILVVRGTHFQEEIQFLLPLVQDRSVPISIVVTYGDKMTSSSKQALVKQAAAHSVPLIVVDTRSMKRGHIYTVFEKMTEQSHLSDEQAQLLLRIKLDKVEPNKLLFDNSFAGPILSVAALMSMFLFPVIIAYWFSSWMQSVVDDFVMFPLIQFFLPAHPFIQSVFTGDYGLFTLGIYSFIWAFPVVFLIGCSTALVDETGIKDRIIDSLDPLLQKIGLHGRDLMPVLSGFGCNVVAVFQSRSCSVCTRKQCVSLITFGSACSYQIGATLSVFNSAHKTWMFLPYILLLVVGSIVHTKLWYRSNLHSQSWLPVRRAFLQKPTWKGISFRLKSDMKQFCTQALPIFAMICLFAATFEYIHVIQYVSIIFQPLLSILQLPAEAASGLAFSIIRKDGILIFNEGNGQLLSQLTDSQLFLLIFLASTMTACFVTMLTVWKELGYKQAVHLISRQLVTSILCVLCIFAAVSLWHYIG